MFYGLYNYGKSYLAASALKALSADGPVLYVSINDEPVQETLISVGAVGMTHVTLEKYDDLDELEKQYTGKGLIGVVLDSAQQLNALALDKITSGARMPGTGGKDGRSEWGQIKYNFFRGLTKVFKLAPFVFVTCPAAQYEDEVTSTTKTSPALNGKLAGDIAGRFPFVGYIDLVTISADKVQRRLHFEPMTAVMTRCNTRQAFSKPLMLENGPGAWAAVRKELEARR